MKSVELKPSQTPAITRVEMVVLTHIVKHGLTTSDVWACPSEFGGLDRITIGRAVRRLVAVKLVERGLMHHGKFYLVPTSEGVEAIGKLGPRVGLLSEATKILAYARLLIGCREKPLYPIHVVAHWLGNTPDIAIRHYLRVTEADFMNAAAGNEPSKNSSEGGAESGALLAQKAAQHTSAGVSTLSQESTQVVNRKGDMQDGAISCDALHTP